MVHPVKPDLRIFPDVESLSRAAAQGLMDRINATVLGGGRFYLALAGGNTPRVLYRVQLERSERAVECLSVANRAAKSTT